MKRTRKGRIETLEAQLRQLRQEGTQLREHATLLLQNLAALEPQASAAASRAMDESTVKLADLARREAGPLWLGWNSPEWDQYCASPGKGPESFGVMTHLRTGARRDEAPLPQEQSADVAQFVPLFAGNGPLVLIGDLRTQDLTRKVMQSLVLRSALGMPAHLRFTLIDPLGLGAAFPFRGDLVTRVRPAGHTVVDELGEVIEDIRRINERVLGSAARFFDLTSEQRAGESFEIIAVADFPKAYSRDPRAVELLVRIARAGPRAGRHLLLEVNHDMVMPPGFELGELEPAVFIDVRAHAAEGDVELDVPPPPPRQHELLLLSMRAGVRQQRADWNRVVRPQTLLTGSSAVRIETPLGERLRFWLGVDAGGAQGSHAIIAGQTGSGKTQLLHVLITGLAARYAPQELQMVLVDGSSGIDLSVYRRLPQAQLICVRTQPAMARSVLADFVAEMEERYEQFQAAGAIDLADHRAKTGRPMPRKLLIVEQYPQLLEGDEERGGQLLMRILEKGRAAGMHVVLVSHAFSARGLPPAALTDIQMRVALSLPPDYVQGLQLFGTEGRRLIRDLSSPGQVVLNDHSGRDGANHAGAVAQLDRGAEGDTVQELVQEIARQHAAQGATPVPPAVVLDGHEAAVVTDNPFVHRWILSPPAPSALEALARLPARKGGLGLPAWSAADRPVGLWLGRRFDVRGHALCALRRAPAENLLVLGSQRDVRNRMLASALAALPSFVPPTQLEITLLDGLAPDMPGGRMLLAACEQLAGEGARLVVAREGALEPALTALAQSVGQTAGPDNGRTRILVVAEPDALASLHLHPQAFSPPATGPAAHLRTLLARGPQHGLHVIVTASGIAALGTVLSPARELRYFNHRAVQPLSEEDSMTLFASLAAARIGAQADHPYASLLVDQTQGVRGGVLFASYTARPDVNASQDIGALRECLAQLKGDHTAAHVA